MLAQSFLLDPIAGNFWSDVIVGAALVVLGGYNYYRRANEKLGSVGVGAFVALLGLWLIATPFILGSTEGTAAVETDIEFWNDIVVGLLTFLLGAYSAYEARDTDVATPAART
ncbi:SPW repeat protein [Halosimplex aquaticum]